LHLTATADKPFHLMRQDKTTGPITSLRLVTVDCKYGRYFEVYRAKQTIDNKEHFYAVKFTYNREQFQHLENEAKIYNEQLKNLQGDLVPHFHGYYVGPEMDMACIVLDYCGEALHVEFCRVDWDLALVVYQAAERLHSEAHLEHGDLHPGNILHISNDKVMFIDFEQAEPHDCGRKMEVVPDDLVPYEHAFGCRELWTTAAELEIWMRGAIEYMGSLISIRDLEDLTVDALAKWAPTIDYRIEATDEFARTCAEESLAKYGLRGESSW